MVVPRTGEDSAGATTANTTRQADRALRRAAAEAPAALVRVTRLGHTLLDAPVQIIGVTQDDTAVLAGTPSDAGPVPDRVARRLATADGPTTITHGDVTWSGVGVGRWGRGIDVCLSTVAVTDGGRTRAALADLAALARDVLRVDEAEADVEDLRELLGTTSHDLRNPLSVLRAGLETLAMHGESLGSAQTERIAELAVRQARRMGTLIDGLLSLHGLEREAEHVPVDVRDLVRDALEAGRLSHDLIELVPLGTLPSAPVEVLGDPDSLARVITNLVTNAAVHGGGHVWVGCEVDDATVVLSVADDGPGMPDDAGFDDDRPRRSGGHGLGLMIARRIVVAHDGDVTHEPRPGGGTVVRIRLPRRA